MMTIKRTGRRFLVGAIGAWIGYCFGLSLSIHVIRLFDERLPLPLAAYRVVGGIVIFWMFMEIGDACERLIESAASGTTSSLKRYVSGQFWRSVAFAATVLLFVAPLFWLLLPAPQPWLRTVAYQAGAASITFGHLVGIGYFILIVALPKHVHFFARFLIGRISIYLNHSGRCLQDGKERSSPVAGLLEEWANPHRRTGIFLGRSLCDPSWSVGVDDNRHVLTVASDRGWLSRSSVRNQMSKWPHSAVVIDSKATNSFMASTRRSFGRRHIFERRNQNVYVLDPFAVNTGSGSMLPSANLNPLSSIDLNSQNVCEDLDMLADAVVMPSCSGDDVMDANAKALIRASIAYAVFIDPHNATLFGVRQLLDAMAVDHNHEILHKMSRSPLAGGVISDSVRQIAVSGPHVVSNIIAAALRHTAWLNDPSIQAVFSKSDFDLLELRRRPTTIYVVLPPDRLEIHARFLRLFVNLAVVAGRQASPPSVPCLLVVDELSVLGRMDSLSKSISCLAGYGIKLWLSVASFSQLLELYGKSWTTEAANDWHLQIIDVRDRVTATHVSQRIGRTVFFNESSRPVCAQTNHSAGVLDFRGDEPTDSKGSPRQLAQLIVREGASHFLLRR